MPPASATTDARANDPWVIQSQALDQVYMGMNASSTAASTVITTAPPVRPFLSP